MLRLITFAIMVVTAQSVQAQDFFDYLGRFEFGAGYGALDLVLPADSGSTPSPSQ